MSLPARAAKAIFLLRDSDTTSDKALKAHLVCLITITISLAFAIWFLRSSERNLRLAGNVLILVPLAIYILERESSLVFSWPLTQSAAKGGVLATHPLLLWLSCAVIFFTTIASSEPLYLVQDKAANPLLRGLAAVSVAICAMPFWVATFLYIPMRRNALLWSGKPGVLARLRHPWRRETEAPRG